MKSQTIHSADERSRSRCNRQTSLAAAIGLVTAALLMAGCDQRVQPEEKDLLKITPTSGPTTQSVSKLERRALKFIPFTAELPSDWTIVSETAGTAMLTMVHGNSAQGEVEILLSQAGRMKPEDVALLVSNTDAGPSSKPATHPAAIVESRILRVSPAQGVEFVEPIGSFTKIRVQLFVMMPGQDSEVYEFTFSGLSEAQVKREREFFRKIVDSLQYDPSAMATP
ncbi:MAG: hypothetical protein QM770_10740 [Tepidisphaeraceae bacterium]